MQVSILKPASVFLKQRFIKGKNGTETCTLENAEKCKIIISGKTKEGRTKYTKNVGKRRETEKVKDGNMSLDESILSASRISLRNMFYNPNSRKGKNRWKN